MAAPLQSYQREYAEVMQAAAQRDRIRNTNTSRIAAANVAAMRRRYPWLKGGAALGLTQAGYGPTDEIVEKVARLQLKQQVRRRQTNDDGGGGLLGAIDDAWDSAYEGLKTGSRWGFAAIAAPLETGIAIGRNAWGTGQDPYRYPADDILNFAEQTQIGQMLQGTDSGEGWLPGQRVFKKMGQAARSHAPTINNHAWTPGRWVASAITEPGTTEYNILSGLTDGAIAYYADPTSLVFKAVGDMRSAAQAFRPTGVLSLAEQGAWRGMRKFVSAPTVEQYLESPTFARVGEWLTNTSDWAEIWTRTKGQLPVRMVNDLADASDLEQIKGVLRPALGTEVPKQLDVMGNLSYTIKQAVGQGRIWQSLPGRVIDLNDIDTAVVQFDAFQRNANLPVSMVNQNLERLARAESRYDQMKVLQDAGDEIFLKLAGRHGVAEKRAMRLTDIVRSRLKKIEEGAIDDIVDDASESAGIAIDGAANPGPSAQLFQETMSAGVAMPDPREIRRLTSVFRPVLDNATTERLRLPFLAADWAMSEVWKPFMLVRAAWTVRVIGEEQIRLSAMGMPTAFSHPLSFISAVTAHKGKVWESLSQNVEDILGHNLKVSDEAMQALARGTAGFRDNKVRTKFLKVFKPDDEGFGRAWGEELGLLNRDPVANAVARSMLESGDMSKGGTQAAKAAFWDGELKWVREEFVKAQQREGFDMRTLADAYIDDVADRVLHSTASDPSLLEGVATGTLKNADGRELQLRHNIEVHQDLVEDLTTRAANKQAPKKMRGHAFIAGGKASEKAVNRWDSAVETMFTFLMSKPTNYLSRSPAFTNFYRGEIERMIPFMDAEGRQAALANARMWADTPTIKRWESLVTQADADDTIRASAPVFNNPGIKFPNIDIDVERGVFNAQKGTAKPTATEHYAREGIFPRNGDDAATLEEAFANGEPFTRRQWAEYLADEAAPTPRTYMTREEADKFKLPVSRVMSKEEYAANVGIALDSPMLDRDYADWLRSVGGELDYRAPLMADGRPAWNGEIINKDDLPDELFHGTPVGHLIDDTGMITPGEAASERGLGGGRNARRQVPTVSLTGTERYAQEVASSQWEDLPGAMFPNWEPPWFDDMGRSVEGPMKKAMLGQLPADYNVEAYFKRLRASLRRRFPRDEQFLDDVDTRIAEALDDLANPAYMEAVAGGEFGPNHALGLAWFNIMQDAEGYGIDAMMTTLIGPHEMARALKANSRVYKITKDQIPDDVLITRIGGPEDEYRIYADIPIRDREASVRRLERQMARKRDRSPQPFEDWMVGRLTDNGEINTSGVFGWVDDDDVWDDIEGIANDLHTNTKVGKVEEFTPNQIIANQRAVDPDQVRHYLGTDKHTTPIAVRISDGQGRSHVFMIDGHHRATADWIKTGKAKVRVDELEDPDLFDRIDQLAQAGRDSSRFAGQRVIEGELDRLRQAAQRGYTSEMFRGMRRVTDRLERWADGAPDDWSAQLDAMFDRHLAVFESGGKAAKQQAVDAFVDEVNGILSKSYERADAMGISAARADHLAKARALEHTKKTLYDLSERSQFFDTFRLIFPFGEAWKEVLTVWSRIGRENPQTIRRFQQGIQAARGAKIPGTDGQYGFFHEDPQTGEEVFTYPGSAFLTEQMLGVPVNLNGRVQGLNLVGNGLPGLGPAVSIPAAYFLPETPEWDFVREQIFPFGEPKQNDIVSAVVAAGVPAWLNKFRTAMGDPQQKVLFNNTVMDVARYMAMNGDYKLHGPDAESEINRLMSDAKQRAKGLYIIRGAAQFFAPSAPLPEMLAKDKDGRYMVAQKLIDDYYKMVDKDPTTAVQEFINKYGDGAFLYMQPKSRPLIAGAPTTQAGYTWARKNKAIVSKYPNVYGLFGPREKDSEFDITTYFRQFESGERQALTPEQAVQLANHRVASILYDQAKAKAPGGSRQEREWLAMVREALTEEYPGFQDQHGLIEKVPTEGLVKETLEAAVDPRLKDNAVAEAVRLYATARDKAMAYAKGRGYTGFQTAENTADIRDWLRQVASAILQEYPDFEPVWDQVLIREVQEG